MWDYVQLERVFTLRLTGWYLPVVVLDLHMMPLSI